MAKPVIAPDLDSGDRGLKSHTPDHLTRILAQLGRALRLGRRCRQFESGISDQFIFSCQVTIGVENLTGIASVPIAKFYGRTCSLGATDTCNVGVASSILVVSTTLYHGGIAQLVDALALQARCLGFESPYLHHFILLMHLYINTYMHLCIYCQIEKPTIQSVRSHERLCKCNPNCAMTPFQDKQWQLSREAANQYITAKNNGLPKPETSIETRKKLSDDAKRRVKINDQTSLSKFRQACAFKFNVYNYPVEFPINLINEHGWYSASNHGGNLNGVSRDHMISVKYAYDHGIDSNLISHPANCKLMIHNENVSKYSKCSISLSELMIRIAAWDAKYNF